MEPFVVARSWVPWNLLRCAYHDASSVCRRVFLLLSPLSDEGRIGIYTWRRSPYTPRCSMTGTHLFCLPVLAALASLEMGVCEAIRALDPRSHPSSAPPNLPFLFMPYPRWEEWWSRRSGDCVPHSQWPVHWWNDPRTWPARRRTRWTIDSVLSVGCINAAMLFASGVGRRIRPERRCSRKKPARHFGVPRPRQKATLKSIQSNRSPRGGGLSPVKVRSSSLILVAWVRLTSPAGRDIFVG